MDTHVRNYNSANPRASKEDTAYNDLFVDPIHFLYHTWLDPVQKDRALAFSSDIHDGLEIGLHDDHTLGAVLVRDDDEDDTWNDANGRACDHYLLGVEDGCHDTDDDYPVDTGVPVDKNEDVMVGRGDSAEDGEGDDNLASHDTAGGPWDVLVGHDHGKVPELHLRHCHHSELLHGAEVLRLLRRFHLGRQLEFQAPHWHSE